MGFSMDANSDGFYVDNKLQAKIIQTLEDTL
jgi:hypothetical protein